MQHKELWVSGILEPQHSYYCDFKITIKCSNESVDIDRWVAEHALCEWSLLTPQTHSSTCSISTRRLLLPVGAPSIFLEQCHILRTPSCEGVSTVFPSLTENRCSSPCVGVLFPVTLANWSQRGELCFSRNYTPKKDSGRRLKLLTWPVLCSCPVKFSLVF